MTGVTNMHLTHTTNLNQGVNNAARKKNFLWINGVANT